MGDPNCCKSKKKKLYSIVIEDSTGDIPGCNQLCKEWRIKCVIF